MELLTGLDAAFLYMESPSLHMHSVVVAVVDPRDLSEVPTFESTRKTLSQSSHLDAALRRRLIEPRLGLHHPVWIEDPDFDIDHHLRTRTAAPPGGARELAALASEIASAPLQRHCPLWELTLVEGLANGRVGFVAKVHRAVADGGGTVSLLGNLLAALHTNEALDAREPRTEPLPSNGELTRVAARALTRALFALPGTLVRSWRGRRGATRRRRRAGVLRARPFRTPITCFNGALSPDRVIATHRLPLAKLERVAKALGVQADDVFLGICSAALREYLIRHGELPDVPLVACMPSTSRGAESGPDAGASPPALYTVLRVDISDPVKRVLSTQEATEAAREGLRVRERELYEEWSELNPPWACSWLFDQYSRHDLANLHRPPVNLVVSWMAGPRQPASIDGARIEAIYVAEPIFEGVGLNLTAYEHAGDVELTILACPDRTPDAWRLIDLLERALDELVGRVAGEATPRHTTSNSDWPRAWPPGDASQPRPSA